MWNDTQTSYRQIHPKVTKWHTPLKLTRREQTVITSLRIGHTYLISGLLLYVQTVK